VAARLYPVDEVFSRKKDRIELTAIAASPTVSESAGRKRSAVA
jgi:hypothetical protein